MRYTLCFSLRHVPDQAWFDGKDSVNYEHKEGTAFAALTAAAAAGIVVDW